MKSFRAKLTRGRGRGWQAGRQAGNPLLTVTVAAVLATSCNKLELRLGQHHQCSGSSYSFQLQFFLFYTSFFNLVFFSSFGQLKWSVMKQQHVLGKFNLSKRCCHAAIAECLLNSYSYSGSSYGSCPLPFPAAAPVSSTYLFLLLLSM